MSKLKGLEYICLSILAAVYYAKGTCTWPAVFENSWHDSQQGTIQFTSTTEITGFETSLYSTPLNTFVCQDETFDTDGVILIRSTTTANALGANWYVYICIQLTELQAGVSYRYYRLHDQEVDAGEQRIKAIIDDSTKVIDSEMCNETHRASGAEFVTIIKQGSEASSYMTCPSVLQGRFEFNYTNSAGTELCNDPDDTEHMNVCTDKTQLAFDDPCTGQSIVYATGSVYCVASVTVGTDTYIQFYNDGSVDGGTTHRFSCMAISSDSLSATVVYNNCTNHQTSTYVPRDHNGDVIGASVSFKPYVFCKGGCTWPSAFEGTTWRDNTRGDITFGTDTLSGWSVTISSTTIDQWECLDNTFFDSEGILIMKSTQTFVHVGGTWTTFICFEMTKVTDNSYYYYQKHEQIGDGGGNERGYFSTDGTVTGKSTICSTGTTVPAAEFHFMVKSGSESASKQYCPPSLLAKMDYTHIDSSGTTTCDASSDNWDVCTNRTLMTFNYMSPSCSTEMAYSAGGEVFCMVNLTSSTYEYVVVYNTDSSPTYRFACIVSNSGGTAASMVYNNCTIGQTPTSYAKLHDGSDIGYLVTMTAFETCPFLGPSTGESTSGGGGGLDILPIIIGAVAGILVLIIIAIVIYCLKFRNRSDVSHNDSDDEKQKSPVENRNGHVEKIKVEEVDTNPALTIQPETRNTLTPLPPKLDTSATSPRVLPPISNHV